MKIPDQQVSRRVLSHGDLLQLKRWNTPTIYNGWEQIADSDAACEGFNLEETRDFMPEMGSMIGYAVTVVVEPSNAEHPRSKPDAWDEYRAYIAGIPGPKVVLVSDLDKPETYGSFWGEVTSNFHRALGCVGTITDGAIRDLDEMKTAGFKALARRLCVGHAHSWPVRWGCNVKVFGREIQPGSLIHADKHGFLVIPWEDQERLLSASLYMDNNECSTVIAAARSASGRPTERILEKMRLGEGAFRANVEDRFGQS